MPIRFNIFKRIVRRNLVRRTKTFRCPIIGTQANKFTHSTERNSPLAIKLQCYGFARMLFAFLIGGTEHIRKLVWNGNSEAHFNHHTTFAKAGNHNGNKGLQ